MGIKHPRLRTGSGVRHIFSCVCRIVHAMFLAELLQGQALPASSSFVKSVMTVVCSQQKDRLMRSVISV